MTNKKKDIFEILAESHDYAVKEERKSRARGWLQLAAVVTIVLCIIWLLAR
ncbi:MAG TPA: hypothetical protein VIY48_19470 [Candidatus Paceibacterota bacterium]